MKNGREWGIVLESEIKLLGGGNIVKKKIWTAQKKNTKKIKHRFLHTSERMKTPGVSWNAKLFGIQFILKDAIKGLIA